MGRPVPPGYDLKRCIGPPLQKSFAELLGTRDEVVLLEAIHHYRERFEAIGMFENEVYPGIPNALDRVAKGGHRLWVVTTKPGHYARRILEHFDLADRFQDIRGSKSSGLNSQKSDLIRDLLHQENLETNRSRMVGDRAEDITGARENGIPAVAVLWGYGTVRELEEVYPDRMVRSTEELLRYLGCATG
jgi:phosphoglycolate phosphatase